MMLVRVTRKFLDRVGPPGPGDHLADGVLGDWYANALFWRPQTALFVSERPLVPVLPPLVPVATVLYRFPGAVACVAAAIGVDRVVLDVQLATTQTHALAKTARRRVPGVMKDFPRLAEIHGVEAVGRRHRRYRREERAEVLLISQSGLGAKGRQAGNPFAPSGPTGHAGRGPN